MEFLCSAERLSCDVLDEDDKLLYFDESHWTLEGAAYFGAKMADIGFLRGLSSTPRPESAAADGDGRSIQLSGRAVR